MANRVSLSYEEQTLNDIATYYSDVQAGLVEFFSGESITLLQRYQLEMVDEASARNMYVEGIAG